MTYYQSPVTAAELGTYLGATVDEDRASYLLERATELCASVVAPLPDGAASVVLDVAARAYSNPANAHSESAGPFAANYGPVSGGLWLTRQNKQTLRRLAGSGGAFTIETMPVTAGTLLPPWEVNRWGGSGVYGSDWDQTP